MILTGHAIAKAVEAEEICIDPFDPNLANPNSYNYRLGPTLRMTLGEVADPYVAARYVEVELSPDQGYVLQPGHVHLGTTVERIGSSCYVPSLIGRSSLGRLGLFLQVSADLGQLGAYHRWTLEMVATQPIRVYPGMIAGQVSFWLPTGETMAYHGYYGTRSDPAPWEPAALLGLVCQQGGQS